MTCSDKHTSLSRRGFNYGGKDLYGTGLSKCPTEKQIKVTSVVRTKSKITRERLLKRLKKILSKNKRDVSYYECYNFLGDFLNFEK